MLTAKDKSRLREYLSIQRGREDVGEWVVEVQFQRSQYLVSEILRIHDEVSDAWENYRVDLIDFFEDYAYHDGPLEDVVTAAKRKRRRS